MHWRYRHLSVDEFQDVNPAQFRLIRALLGQRGDLCVVGDPNQAVYGWNGADPALLARLPRSSPAWRCVHLDENHRSTPQVVAAATAALGRTLTVPPRSAAAEGPLPIVTAFDDDAAEAEAVATALLDRAEDGLAWSDQAVLARTHDQLATVARALAHAGVPHHMAPGPERPRWRPVPVVRRRRSGAAVRPSGPTGRSGRRAGRGRRTGHLPSGQGTRVGRRSTWWASRTGFVPIVYAESAEAQDEERRLLYVALTRASRELYCSWARSRRMAAGRPMERQPSPWLAAVARVSRAGTGRAPRRDTDRMIAEIRAGLGR